MGLSFFLHFFLLPTILSHKCFTNESEFITLESPIQAYCGDIPVTKSHSFSWVDNALVVLGKLEMQVRNSKLINNNNLHFDIR